MKRRSNQYHECGEPLCHIIVPINQRYCSTHKKQHDDAWQRKKDEYRRTKLAQTIKASKARQYDKEQRDQEAIAFYHSSQWKAVRDAVYARDMAQCQVCGNIVTDRKIIDHIVPRRLCSAQQALSSSNLWVLCYKCHYKKTKLEQIIAAQQNGDIKLAHLDRHWWTKVLREKKAGKHHSTMTR